ncbi:MAG: PQQ-dependent sugar dehydrogenase [Actinomycetota bacterium]|nr:PQQ-dependent sugar dehydrogenase [Actinomycetota bacterium]
MHRHALRPFWCALAAVVGLALASAPAGAADVTSGAGLSLEPLLPGGATFTQPVYVTAPPGDAQRVLVVQQTGVIRVLKNGVLQSDPFMTVPDVHDSGEQGLLSMAFAPDYATSGRFYVYYSDNTSCDASAASCDDRVDEFQRGADADHGSASTRRRVLIIGHQTFQNHNGGQLQFGPDGYLYVSTGDGGGGGDTLGSGQNPNTLLGKLLRIDPRGAADGDHTIPLDNPFVGVASTRPEIWAYGLRNPWRFSFDRLLGDLTIGDVGQGAREEVDFQPRGQGGGANYGWNTCEGDLAYPGGGPCPPDPAFTAPVLTYGRGPGICGAGASQSSITGGYVSRDASIPALLGRYLYADFCRGFMRSAVLGPGASGGDADLGVSVTGVSSFGEDALCHLYVASAVSGVVYRLEAQTPATPGCQTTPSGPGPGPGAGPTTGSSSSPAASLSTADAHADVTAPILTDLRLTRRSFAVGSKPTAMTALRRGTVFRFAVSEAATVRIAIGLRVSGRLAGGRCRPATRRLRARPGCTRYLGRGALVRSPGAGRRSIAFSGRLGRRALRAGSYRAVLTATDAGGNTSRGRQVDFAITAG